MITVGENFILQRMMLFGVTIWFVVVVLGCSGQSEIEDIASESTNQYGFEVSTFSRSDSVFTIDDVKSTGWKFSKELPHDQLSGVSAVWFGFFQQKNLEVWSYESHLSALELGVASAEEIVETTRGVSGGAAGPYMKQSTHYGAYGVIGNLLILCEQAVSVCKEFAEALP